MQTVKIKPAPGLRVRTPDGGLLPEAGATVELTSYWRRRIAAGDVVEVQATPEKTEV
jgi:hypothetical protein